MADGQFQEKEPRHRDFYEKIKEKTGHESPVLGGLKKLKFIQKRTPGAACI